MNRETEILAKATAMLVKEQRDALMQATVDFVGETRKELAAEIENKTAALAAVAAAASANAAAAVAPAAAAADARKAALLRRRKDTIETVGGWLARCVDDDAA